jgi:hypothetical protein
MIFSLSSSKRIISIRKTEQSNRRLLWLWSCTTAIVVLIYFYTIGYSPHLDGDELTIIDFGRTILNPNTDWSIVWMSSKEQPVFLLSYVGPVFQELIYEIVGQYGPRISGIIGAIVATITLLGWLRARKTDQNVAFILSLVFLLDPIFVSSYTKGRVDGWAISYCLAACWLLRHSANGYSTVAEISKWRYSLAGALTVISFFIWPSAVFLVPLTLLELVYLTAKWKTTNRSLKTTIMPILLFGIYGMVTGILLFIPIASRVYNQFNNVIDTFKANTQNGSWFGNQSGLGIESFLFLLRVLKFTPVLTLIGVIAMIGKRQWGLMLAALAATILMLCTVVYIHRVQYLLPYFIAAVAVTYSSRSRNNQYAHFFKKSALALILAWAIFISLGMRTILTFYDRKDRDRNLVCNAALTMVGKGYYKVLLAFPYEFYYVGRSLGWKLYAPYAESGYKQNSEMLKQILHHVDYAILPQEMLSNEIISELDHEGMHYRETCNTYKQKVEPNYYFLDDFSKITIIDRLRILFRIYQQPYGPYILYSR